MEKDTKRAGNGLSECDSRRAFNLLLLDDCPVYVCEKMMEAIIDLHIESLVIGNWMLRRSRYYVSIYNQTNNFHATLNTSPL